MTQWDFLKFSFDIDSFLLDSINSFVVEFTINKVKFELCFVCKISESAHHRCDLLNLSIEISMMSGCLINGFIELELPKGVLFDIIVERELMTDWDCEITIVFDDFSEIS